MDRHANSMLPTVAFIGLVIATVIAIDVSRQRPRTHGPTARPTEWSSAADTVRAAVSLFVRNHEGGRHLLSVERELQCTIVSRVVQQLADLATIAVEEIAQNATFATNSADKLVYQMDNFEPLTHRLSSPQWNPARFRDNDRRQKRLVIGLSTVARSTDYVGATIHAMISALNDIELSDTLIVALNAQVPPRDHVALNQAKLQLDRYVKSGTLHFVERDDADAMHAAMKNASHLPRRWGDSADRVRWRSKQVLDVAWLMDYVARTPHFHAAGYFVMMEDDIDSAKNFASKIRSWMDQRLYDRTDWTVASFYNPWEGVADEEVLPPYKFFGVIGQLFRIHDLPVVVEFLRRNFAESPLDWLMVDFLKKFEGRMIVHSPSYFQHRGTVSSFAGKRQEGRSVDYEAGT